MSGARNRANVSSSRDARSVPSRVRAWAQRRRTLELTLYGSVTIVAVILGVSVNDSITTGQTLVVVMWATSFGLVAAHAFAVAISHRIVSPEPLPLGRYLSSFVDGAPLLISSAVATLGVIVAQLFDNSLRTAARGADIALVAFCCTIAWIAGSVHGLPMRRRLALSTFIGVVLTLIAIVKVLLDP